MVAPRALGMDGHNAAGRDGAISRGVVRRQTIGRDHVDDQLFTLLVELEDLRRHTLTVVKRHCRDRTYVDVTRPPRDVGVQHESWIVL